MELCKIAEYDYGTLGSAAAVVCDCGMVHTAKVVGDVGQRLEWVCPFLGPCGDVNA